MKQKISDELLTTLQVVLMSGVAGRSTVKYWERSGKLRAIRVGPDHGKFGGAQRLFRKSDVIAFLVAREKKKESRKGAATG